MRHASNTDTEQFKSLSYAILASGHTSGVWAEEEAENQRKAPKADIAFDA